MKNIGQRIKDLRKKNDLTQEKLADYLGVTYKSVSKWECGLTTPDLALIVPLSKILGVSTDELLGAKETDARLEELERLYDEAGKIDCLNACLPISETAVNEYPSDMKWLNRYAWDIWCRANDTIPDGEEFEAVREKVIEMFDRVIGNTDDDEIKATAITGIVGCFCGKGCKKEARHYVDLFPETKADPTEKKRLLGACLEGEEQIRHKQKYLEEHFDELVRMLIWNNIGDNRDTCTAAESIIMAMIPDENYCEHHHSMSQIKFRKAEIAASEGNIEAAVELLKEAIYHAKEYDLIDSIAPGEYRYTAPLFDHLTIDSREWCHSEGTFVDGIKEMSKRNVFDSIRDRKDFKALFE